MDDVSFQDSETHLNHNLPSPKSFSGLVTLNNARFSMVYFPATNASIAAFISV